MRSTYLASGALMGAMAMTGCSKDPGSLTSGDLTSGASATTVDDASSSTDATMEGEESSGMSSSAGSEEASSTDTSNDTTTIPDYPPINSGCIAVDMLFVVDNSASMGQYQDQLADAFPTFIDALWDVLPPDVDMHIGITTSDFAGGCDTPEATLNCQSTADVADIVGHYIKPTDSIGNGQRGSQGRLYAFDNQFYYAASTSDDPTDLKTWFQGAARSAGEEGCTYEMPVAAAGWAANPINTGATGNNNGFFRDEGSLLVVFFLTDEPDKSPEYDTHVQALRNIKQGCGGDECIFMAGLIPPCTLDTNQKLWQFMNAWGDPDPAPWGDIYETQMYPELVGTLLAQLLGDKCEQIPPVG